MYGLLKMMTIMTKLKTGDIVRFKKDYAYDSICPHCDSDIVEYINKGDERVIRKIGDSVISVYECHIHIEECNEYLELVERVES